MGGRSVATKTTTAMNAPRTRVKPRIGSFYSCYSWDASHQSLERFAHRLDTDDLHPRWRVAGRYVALRHNAARKAQLRSFTHAHGGLRGRPHLAGQSNFPKHHGIAVNRTVSQTRGDRR